ncbi:potassium channel family protein [Mycoplasmopsis hyopharyngis]|uniref:potassium channel family protein n=1 Tax=Mycoplasmopsis hyopharyngis TaxID=29558 RepID=UPI00387338FC
MKFRFRNTNKDICVIGAGRFGSAVISQLAKMKCPVLVIEKEEEKARPFVDVVQKVVIADAADINVLRELDIQKINTVVVAMPDNIEVIACLLELKVNNIIARAVSKRHARVLQQIGVDVIIRPEHEAGVRTALFAANPSFSKNAENLQELSDGFVMGTTILKDETFEGKQIKNLNWSNNGVSIVLISRNGSSFIPHGDFVLRKNDSLTLIGKIEDITRLFTELSPEK